MTTNSETRGQCLNFVRSICLISVLVFVSRDFELGTKWPKSEVDRQSRTGLIYLGLNTANSSLMGN